jgi:hypothetical protein
MARQNNGVMGKFEVLLTQLGWNAEKRRVNLIGIS